MITGFENAFACAYHEDSQCADGLSKFEYIAIEVFKGFCSNPEFYHNSESVLADQAVSHAKALIAAIQEEQMKSKTTPEKDIFS